MNENINKKFDVKNFDYDKCYEEVKENASKNINIIVCGATGVGKSSLINDFFEFDMIVPLLSEAAESRRQGAYTSIIQRALPCSTLKATR